jgi:hypothetical protein
MYIIVETTLLLVVIIAKGFSLSHFSVASNSTAESPQHRLLESRESETCNRQAMTANKLLLEPYFKTMQKIYKDSKAATCLPIHEQCGWPSERKLKKLPLMVLSVGLEGAGHHLWTELLEKPVFDCVWANARHYKRAVGDGVARTTPEELRTGFMEQLKMRTDAGKQPCKSIYDSEDSFPTGAIRKSGRVFMHPDLVNLHMMDGVLFNVKYLIILRNITDTSLSALRRNFFPTVDQELRTVEHTLTYIESAMRGIPCHKTFIAHYEHVLYKPEDYMEPLAQFLELDAAGRAALKATLRRRTGKLPSRKAHNLMKYPDCKRLEADECYKKIANQVEDFFIPRGHMWPTFAANGFDII